MVSERLGHASTSITANLYQHVLPSMVERTANAVANLPPGPSVHEPQEGGDARTPSSGGVSEGRLKHYAYQGSLRRLRYRAASTRVAHDAAGWLELRRVGLTADNAA
jgi:hypothetical protein